MSDTQKSQNSTLSISSEFRHFTQLPNTTAKKNTTNILKGKTIDELIPIFERLGEPKFRAKQAFIQINKNLKNKIEEFTDFPLALRNKISINEFFPRLKFYKTTLENENYQNAKTKNNLSSNKDKTEKVIYELEYLKNNFAKIESVWIVASSGKRRTICISSQIGCTLNCSFCATGTLPFKGNLPTWAILDQVYDLIRRRSKNEKLTNIVFMGMGEPFHNFENVIKAAHILHDPLGLNIGANHITISTAGVVPQIYKFIEQKEPFNLAISLNHVTNKERLEIMDVTEKYNLKELMEAATNFIKILNRRITFEYVMIKNLNMSKEHAEKLIKLTSNLSKFCRINLIPLNTKFNNFQRPSFEESLVFQKVLLNAGLRVFNRGSPGLDINAACGMLALKE